MPGPLLLVDSLNVFIRSWAAYPTMSSHGYQMGGTIGYLKTLSRLVSDYSPSAVYIAWESGGSTRRRALFKEYKLGRKTEKLNRFYGNDLPESEENRRHQLIVLMNILKHVPVCQLYVNDCEGDDLIAYLCRVLFSDTEKIIVSSDKDMYQLLDKHTRVYNLHKKTFITDEDVLKTYKISAQNFAIAKALCGDIGDNVPGVKGLGFKKTAKYFPQLALATPMLLDDVLNYCKLHKNEAVAYRKVAEQEHDVQRNWKLVYLDGLMLSAAQATKIDHAIKSVKLKSNKIEFMRTLVAEGINDFNIENFFYAFNCVEGLDKTHDTSRDF